MDWAGIAIGIICALPSLLGGLVGCLVLLWIDHEENTGSEDNIQGNKR